MNKLSRRELAEQKKQEFIKSAQLAASSVVSQEKYNAAKEVSECFNEIWSQPGLDRKRVLAFMLRRIASLVESSFIANVASSGVKDAVWNVTGALLGGAEGAGSMSQMGVQQAGMKYRTARMAADNLYQLAREIEEAATDLPPDLIEETKEAALLIRREGFGHSWENISLLLAAADNLVSSIYGFDARSIGELHILENNREEAFKKHWNQNRVRVGMSEYEAAGKQYYRRLFHNDPKTDT